MIYGIKWDNPYFFFSRRKHIRTLYVYVFFNCPSIWILFYSIKYENPFNELNRCTPTITNDGAAWSPFSLLPPVLNHPSFWVDTIYIQEKFNTNEIGLGLYIYNLFHYISLKNIILCTCVLYLCYNFQKIAYYIMSP